MQGKTYKNKALSALFLMNNVHYLVKAVESSPALAVIGEDWIELHRDQACLPSLPSALSLFHCTLTLPVPYTCNFFLPPLPGALGPLLFTSGPCHLFLNFPFPMTRSRLFAL